VNNKDTNILIIGTGISGAVLAWLLIEKNNKVRIIIDGKK
jgi:L-2-hydroxyglutarate oxidase LhgO